MVTRKVIMVMYTTALLAGVEQTVMATRQQHVGAASTLAVEG
jgi:hypothetical protein